MTTEQRDTLIISDCEIQIPQCLLDPHSITPRETLLKSPIPIPLSPSPQPKTFLTKLNLLSHVKKMEPSPDPRILPHSFSAETVTTTSAANKLKKIKNCHHLFDPLP